jgi:negative regulator of flagellin synthesis FlgM
MKIGNISDKPALAPASAGTPAANEPAAAIATAAPREAQVSAKVELSSAASSLMATGASAEFDADKVARISQAVADGSFKVNPEVIADKLIANAQELLSKGLR